MKRSLATKGIAIILFCCMMAAVMPIQKVEAAVYNSTLQFGVNYEFNGEGGYQKFDLCIEKSGRVTFNFIALDSNGETGIYLYDENESQRMTVLGYKGSYKATLDLKAGNYVIIFNNSRGTKGHYVNGTPYDKAPTNGTLIASFSDSKETFEENQLVTNNEVGVASHINNIGNVRINGQFALNDSIDFYSFNVKKSQKVAISYVAPMTSSKIHVYKDSLDLEYWEQDIAAGSHKYTYVLPAGNYYISIENKNTDVTGNYTLQFISSRLDSSKLMSVKSNAKKTMEVKYSKISTADKYQIQIASNSSFTKSVKTYTTDTTSKKISKLTSKKTYYVRVRTITYANEYKCYSAWSSAKKIKVK